MSTLAVTTVTSANNTTDLTLRSANTNAGAIIVSANGTGITLQSNSTTNAMIINSTAWYIGGVQLNNTVVRQSFTGNGSTTSFTVTGGYTPNNLDVYENGIKISSPDVITSSGTSIVFAVAPPSGALIEVVGQIAGTINYSTVNTQTAYTWTNTHTFNNTVTINNPLYANDTTISGNLTVLGTTTTVNSATLDVKDLNITIAKGAGSASAANGAGITVDTGYANLYYSSSANAWSSTIGITVSGNILPSSDNLYNLGSATYRWANVFTGDLHLSNENTNGNDIDGTTGNWTLQEGKNDIFIINNNTGKKFKFKLEEII